MLVKPPVGRHEAARFMPWHGDFFFFPENRIAFPYGNNNHAPRAMAMRLLVQARIEDRHMAGHFRVGELHVNAPAAGTAANIGIELVPGSHVREKVAVPKGSPAPRIVQRVLLNHLGLGIKIHLILNIWTLVAITEDKVWVAHTRQS